MVNIAQFYYKKSRLQQLKGFCLTIQLGSARKASQKMGLDPSAISLQIKSLERDLGVKLFTKDRNRLIPTKDGKTLYEMSIGYVYGVDNIFNKFLDKVSSNSKSLNIAVHHIFASYVIPKYIKTFIESNPETKIALHNLSVDDAINSLRNDEIDLAIYPLSKVPIWCSSKQLISYDPVLLLHKNNPLAKLKTYTMKDLSKHTLIRVSSDVVTMPGFEELATKNKFKNIIWLNKGSWEILMGLVKADAGFTFIHTLFLRNNKGDFVTKPADKYLPKVTYGIIMKKGKVLEDHVKNFLEIIDSIKRRN